MYFVFIITLLLVGLLAASAFVENKIPQSKVAFEVINPFSNWIGLVSMVLGLFWLLRTITYLGTMLKWAPVNTLIYIASLLLLLVLGFILAQSLLKQFSGKNEKIDGFVNKVVSKFKPMQEKLGLAAIATALLNLLLRIT